MISVLMIIMMTNHVGHECSSDLHHKLMRISRLSCLPLVRQRLGFAMVIVQALPSSSPNPNTNFNPNLSLTPNPTLILAPTVAQALTLALALTPASALALTLPLTLTRTVNLPNPNTTQS